MDSLGIIDHDADAMILILPVMSGHRVKHVEVLQTPWD